MRVFHDNDSHPMPITAHKVPDGVILHVVSRGNARNGMTGNDADVASFESTGTLPETSVTHITKEAVRNRTAPPVSNRLRFRLCGGRSSAVSANRQADPTKPQQGEG